MTVRVLAGWKNQQKNGKKRDMLNWVWGSTKITLSHTRHTGRLYWQAPHTHSNAAALWHITGAWSQTTYPASEKFRHETICSLQSRKTIKLINSCNYTSIFSTDQFISICLIYCRTQVRADIDRWPLSCKRVTDQAKKWNTGLNKNRRVLYFTSTFIPEMF